MLPVTAVHRRQSPLSRPESAHKQRPHIARGIGQTLPRLGMYMLRRLTLHAICACGGQGEEFLTSLEPVVRVLAEEVPNARLDRKALAALSAQLQQFQEDALGIKVPLQSMFGIPP